MKLAEEAHTDLGGDYYLLLFLLLPLPFQLQLLVVELLLAPPPTEVRGRNRMGTHGDPSTGAAERGITFSMARGRAGLLLAPPGHRAGALRGGGESVAAFGRVLRDFFFFRREDAVYPFWSGLVGFDGSPKKPGAPIYDAYSGP
jgi:hypothetical protein